MTNVAEMTHQELIDGAKGRWGLGKATVCEAELLRRLGAAVSASPQPRCPKCHGKIVLRNLFNEPTAFCAVQCPTCIPTDGFWLIRMAEDMAQFFAAAPAQEPRMEEVIANARNEFGDSRHCTAKEAIDFIERKLAQEKPASHPKTVARMRDGKPVEIQNDPDVIHPKHPGPDCGEKDYPRPPKKA